MIDESESNLDLPTATAMPPGTHPIQPFSRPQILTAVKTTQTDPIASANCHYSINDQPISHKMGNLFFDNPEGRFREQEKVWITHTAISGNP